MHIGHSRGATALRPQPRRHRLALACQAALFGLLVAGAAQAQDTPPTSPAQPQNESSTPANTTPSTKKPAKPGATTLQTVVVTGIRGSIESSIKAKQNSDDIIEAVSAEDIGKLPDASIAESLARLPGLATQRLDGRANVISIRGLSPDFAGTTLNGREQATIGENRGVEYDQYPSELISSAAVYKTPDASLIGQGLSGTVDLHTIRPLDLEKRTVVLNLRGEHTTNGKLNPGSGVGDMGHRASFSYIDQFLDHTLGVAVGFAQLDSPIQEKQYQAWWWSMDNGPGSIESPPPGGWGGPHTPGMPDNVISQEGMQL
ncbi:MAG: TonB-dependent receptor plug domain-containing protein, partial [Dyella sp.]|uniref:TonB-dependent receptor plug domain-containing protein n=1 Tax=Dyella sp. TaxID=1869338 RepID=UPI003F7D4D60